VTLQRHGKEPPNKMTALAAGPSNPYLPKNLNRQNQAPTCHPEWSEPGIPATLRYKRPRLSAKKAACISPTPRTSTGNPGKRKRGTCSAPFPQANDRFLRLALTQSPVYLGFVSGHGFSRAVKAVKLTALAAVHHYPSLTNSPTGYVARTVLNANPSSVTVTVSSVNTLRNCVPASTGSRS
jgi:hypothetical protein